MTHATFNFSAADTHTTKHPHAPALRRTGACRGTISVRLFPRLAIIGACLAAALLFGFAAPAQADEPEFVNNFDGGYLHHVPIGGTSADGWTKMRYHQAFTTGNNTDGYELKSVTVRFYSSETSPAPTNGIFPGTFKVFLCSNSDYDSGSQPTYQDDDSADSNDCDRSFDTLATYGVRKYTYTRDAAIALERSTTYIISLKYTPPNSGSDIKPKWILTGDEDETSDYGFEISNELWGRGWDGNSWESKNWNDQIFHLGLVGANGVPTAGNQQSVIIDEDTEHTFQEEDFGYEDADSDDLDHVKITDLPGQGTLWLDSDGDAQFDEGEAVAVDDEVTSAQLDNSLDDNLKYTPPADANGSPFTTFKFKVNDGYDDSAEYIFILNVTAVNDVPTVSDSTVDATEDALYTFEVDDFVFTDIDQTDNVNEQGDSLSHLRITTLPGTGKGTLEFEGTPITSEDVNENESKTVERSELVAGDLKYRPPLNANGTDFTSFDFKAKDGIVDSLSEATMTINVTAVNDLPTASNKTVDMVEDENTVYTFAEADFGFEDIDSNATLNEDPTLNATLAHVKLTSLPAAGKGMLSLAGNDITSASEDTPVEVTTTQLTAGDFTYTLPANGSGSPYAMFNFKVYDGAADSEISYTVSFYVAAVNDQPVAVNDPIVADANTVHVINVLENDSDVDGDTLSISALGTGDNAPADGTAEIISFGSTPAVRYTPNNDFIGTDTFTYTISDGQSPALTDTARVTMTVVPKLEGPINQDYPENGTEATNGMDNVVAVVATYSATGTPTWSLAGADRDDFSINANGELSFNSLHNDDENPLPDYENATDADTDNEYKITVQATVEVGGVPYTGTRDVTVTVTGVDEDVVWSVQQNTEFSFAENGTAAAATITVTDPENELSGFSLVGVDYRSFTYSGTELAGGGREVDISFLSESPDYENPTDIDVDNVYEPDLFVRTGTPGNYKQFILYHTIRVTDVNEAPVAGDDEPSTNEDTPVVISVLANDTDQDEDADGNPKDTLSVTAVGTADGVNTATEINPANGSVVITPESTTTVTYTPNADFNGTDTFTYVVSDGELTAIGTVTVTVNAVNDPPVAVDDTLTIDEGEDAEIDVITDSDSDVDGDTLSVSAVESADNGTTAIKSGSTTTVTYTPNANFAGIDTFTYTVSDGQDPALTDTGTVTVKVTPTVSGPAGPNYAENGTDSVATYTAGGNPSPTWTLSGTDDSDKFNIGSSSGVLSFKEPPDYEDPDGIYYDVTVVASADGVTGMLDVTVTVTDVAAGNDPPVARDDTATTYEVTDVDIDVLLNDTAHEGITLSVTVGTGDDGPSNGTAVLKPGPTTMITYTPNTGFAGIDSFTYTVSDGQDPALTDTGTVTVRVTPTVSGSAVTGLPKSPSYAENGTGSVATYTANGSPTWSLSGTDSDKFSIGSATGKLTFNSPPNFENAADASDGNDYELMVVATITADGVSVTGSLDVTVTVTDVNEAPTFDGSSTTRNINENSAAGTNVGDAVTATDPDTSEPLYSDLTYSLGGDTDKDAFDIDESTGWISVKTGTTLNYENKNSYSVTVEVTDGKNAAGTADNATDDTITVDISVTDLPAVTGLTAIEYQENGTDSLATYETSGTVEWSLEDSGDDDHFSIDASTGELNFNATTFPKGPDFEIPTDANGDNVYELTVVANDSGETGRLGVTVEVTDASNAPVANDDTLTVSEDASATHLDVIDNDTIADLGFTLSVSVVGNPLNGTAAIKEDSTTEVTYTPNENFDGEDTFTYTVSNGARPPETETATGTVTVTVTAVNDPPVAADDFATTDGREVVIDVLANDTDVDEDILSVIEVEGAADGTVVITDDGATVTYTPGENFIANGSDSFTYTVSDGNEASMDTGMVTVMANFAPTASGKTVTRFEGMTYTFKVDDFDYKDADGHELEHVKIISLPEDTNGAVQGTLSLDGVAITSVTPPPQVTAVDLEGGKLKHTPPANGNPVTTFSYKVNDGLDDSNESTIRINVVSVRSMSFGAAAYEADEGGAVAVKVILNQPAIVALTIPITVTARTAEAGDYKVGGLVNDPDQDVTGSLIFGAGQDTRTFTITAEEDDDFDDETVTLGFGVLTERGVTRGEPATATLTIIDDEGNVIRARFRRLNNEILSKHALTLADVTIAAVTSRQEAGPTCADQAITGSLGGSSTLAKILTANVQTLTTGSLNLKQLLGTSSLRLRLTEDGSGAGPGCLTLWGQGDYRNLSSGDSQALDWNGDLVTGQVGADALLRPDLLAGLAVSWSEGDFGYTDRTDGGPFSGDYTSRMVSVHPYVTWWSPIGLDVWATGGYGRGEIKIKDEQAGTYSSDTTLRLASVGASGPLLIGDGLIGRGTTTVRLKAQGSLAQMEVEGHGSLLQEQTIDAHRLRLAMEGSHERPLASGGSLTPSFEVGLRHDGGDGATGTGLELGGGLRYMDPAWGLTIEGRGRVLSSYDDTYKEWGASGLLRLGPGAAGQGLSLSLVPSYGQTASGVQRLWDQGLPQGPTQGAPTTQALTGRLEAEVGYGLAAFAGQGLLTPYGQFSLGGGTQQYRVGSRLQLGPALRLSLEGTHQVTTVGQADQGIRLQADWQF